MKKDSLEKLAQKFMGQAVCVQEGQNIWIEHAGPAGMPLAQACAERVKKAGGAPYIVDRGRDFLNHFIPGKTDQELEQAGQEWLDQMKTMHGYIRIGDEYEECESKVGIEDFQRYRKLTLRPMTNFRVENTHWLVVRAPTEYFLKASGMNEEDILRIYLYDHDRMIEPGKPLEKLMGGRHVVEITGKDTDLSFETIGGGQSKLLTGMVNLPDGEVFTAPIRDSVNGHIRFGPIMYNAQRFNGFKLDYKDGRVTNIQAETAERERALWGILDTDEGARFIGEFAIGFHPYIFHPTGDILFDEKITGSIHFAQGQCYRDWANNGNDSGIHMDMTHIQRPEYGGGEIRFGGHVVCKDGRFVPNDLTGKDLLGLNPENLT